MAEPSSPETMWRPWIVAPKSGFEVQDVAGEGDDTAGTVGLLQIDNKQFDVTKRFRFSAPGVEKAFLDRLVRNGMNAAEARAAIDEARTFTPRRENPTDLASIPRYMRWFESSYGLHTLAAVIHDGLIVDTPNDGALRSDTLSDRFFREMMKAAGVPWLKRWIMWAAVALRSRWAAGGVRRASLCIWILLAAVGITAFVWAVGAALLGWGRPVDTWVLFAVALLLPFAAAPLWGRQYGAGLVAAVAGLWILPAAAFGGLGYLIYMGLERLARGAGLD